MATEPQGNDVPYAPPMAPGAERTQGWSGISEQQAKWIAGGVWGAFMLIAIAGYCLSPDPDPEKFGESLGKMLIYGLVLAALVSTKWTRLPGVALAVLAGIAGVAGFGMALLGPHKPTIGQIAAAANQHCPKQVDENTRIDTITSAGDKELIYHYTVTGVDEDALRGAKTQLEANATATLKGSKQGKELAGDDVTFIYANAAGVVLVKFTMHL